VVEFDCITLQCSIGVLTGWDLMWVYYSVLFCKYVAPILSVLVLYNLHDTPLTKKNSSLKFTLHMKFIFQVVGAMTEFVQCFGPN